MKRKIVLMAVLAFTFTAMFAMQSLTSVRAETGAPSSSEPPLLPPEPSFPKWFVDANGTVFQVTNSSYFNVTLTSSEPVHVFLESVPRVVSYGIESLSSATSTVLTLSGFVPSSTYYRYQDGNFLESFVTDSVGNYTYVQDTSSRHHIFIVENMATIYIQPDGTVYSDTGQPVPISVSVVDGIYTYTFTDNITETIVVQRDNIVIDGNGYTLQGGKVAEVVGFYLSGRSGVTIKNVTVKECAWGIWLHYSSNNIVSGNNITANNVDGIGVDYSSTNIISGNNIANNYYGIFVYSSSNIISGNNIANNEAGIYLDYSSTNIISGNNIANNEAGIWLDYSSTNIISGNNIANNGWGIWLHYSSNNIVSGNNITANNVDGIWLDYSSNNCIYHNNIINNAVQAADTNPEYNHWHHPDLLEGNYWSDYPGVDDGSGTYKHAIAGDGIGDTNIPWPGPSYDYYPFVHKNGWLGNTPVGTNIVFTDSVTGITVTFDGVTSTGNTVITTSTTGPPPPTGFRLVGVPGQANIYYDVSTTATYTGTITIAFPYDETQTHGPEGNLHLWQRNTNWNDITWNVDTTNNIIYGHTDHLSTFIITEPLPYLTVQTQPIGLTTIPGEGWYDFNTMVSLEAPTEVAGPLGVRYIFDHWTVDGNIISGNPISVHMDSAHTAMAIYNTQYHLTVDSPYDLPGGEGWYNAGDTAYATLQVGLEYVNGLAYGFNGWTVNTQPWGWDLLSDPIIMNSPKTAIASWAASQVYGDVRTIGFWKHQVNVWYFTELAKTMKIRGIGTAQISEDALIAYLRFIDTNSDYFRGKIVRATTLDTLRNAYNFLKTPTGTDSMKMRAEQQLLALWLNLAHKAFFWNTQLSQDTVYIYYQYTFDEFSGLATIGEAIKFAEAELSKADGYYEAAKNVCDSINNNLGIVWGT